MDGENLAASNATIPLKKKISGRILCYERFLYFGIAKVGITTTNESSYQTVLHWIWGTEIGEKRQVKKEGRKKRNAGEKRNQVKHRKNCECCPGQSI